MTGLFNSCGSVIFTSCFLFNSAFSPSLIASFDRLLCKNGLHHSVLRAIIRLFVVVRSIYGNYNEEWCALSTYKIGLTFTV